MDKTVPSIKKVKMEKGGTITRTASALCGEAVRLLTSHAVIVLFLL